MLSRIELARRLPSDNDSESKPESPEPGKFSGDGIGVGGAFYSDSESVTSSKQQSFKISPFRTRG